MYYVRNASIVQDSRELQQQDLLRAILDRITSGHLLTNPLTADHVVSAMVSMLTVDSNFTNSEVESLATRLNSVSGSGGTFVTAPTYTTSGQVASQLVRERSALGGDQDRFDRGLRREVSRHAHPERARLSPFGLPLAQ